jgi:hypothetical protein
MVEVPVARLAARLKTLRKERDLTLDELDERSDVSRSAFRRSSEARSTRRWC